jgi:hypothetical protein
MSNSTDAELTEPQIVEHFNSDGFTVMVLGNTEK